jgi:hypothetical protein
VTLARRLLPLAVAFVSMPLPIGAQQVGDTTFVPGVARPAFAPGEGPRVVIDEGHVNFHTVSGRFAPFARLLRADGFVVEGEGDVFTPESLADVDVLVIANALHPSDAGEWALPNPSAFSEAEIVALRNWVEDGGALLLIADHMPFPGAAGELASAFDFELRNGFARELDVRSPMVFRRSDGSLADHAITRGSPGDERVDSVATFTGQAFRAPETAHVLLTLGPGVVSLEPEVAWEFTDDTPTVDVGGWAQAAVVEVGAGRMAMFGEAAMFSAQRQGTVAMGMNAPIAGQNPQFVLNVIRWLAQTGR